MQKAQLSPELSAVCFQQPQTNFTSQFFSNFIDHSHIESDSSSISKGNEIANTSELLHDVSINEQKILLFQTQNLLYISAAIIKRIFVNKWRQNKNYYQRLDSRNSQNMEKVIWKVFYKISEKLYVSYKFAFNKIAKLTNQKRNSVKADREIKIKLGINKLQSIVTNLEIKNWFQFTQRFAFKLLLGCDSKRKAIQFIISLFQIGECNLVASGWQSIQDRITYLSKIDILAGTLSLKVHQCMRQVFWSISSANKLSLQNNDISSIQEEKSHKGSFKMNNSIESIALHKEILESCPANQNKYHEQGEIQTNFLKKKQSTQNLDKNNPKNLKFSRDVKRKNPTPNPSSITIANTYQQIEEPSRNQNIGTPLQLEGSILKPQNEDGSLLNQGIAINASIYQSRSFIKRVLSPIQYKQFLICPSISTSLQDDNLPLILNDGSKNKKFDNNSIVTKAKTLKHQQFRKQFTDFNDLFSIRQIISFYQNCKVRGEQSKKSISLANIKEKINVKTQEQYYSRQNINLTDREQYTFIEKIATQPNINSKREGLQRTFNSIKINASQSRQRNFRQSQRKTQFRIPNQLPKNFDYYLDKSVKREPRIQKSMSPGLLLDGRQSKRKSIGSKSSKKVSFNVVKSGSLKVDLLGKKSEQKVKRERIEFNTKKSREKRLSKQQRSPPQSNCEYFINFREVPKKKVRKN